MKSLSFKGVVITVLAPLTALALFYSMAAHLYLSLGHWPDSIGYWGFTPALVFHAELQCWSIVILVLMSTYCWLPTVVACAVIPQGRRFLPYLAIFALTALMCFGLMLLAPGPFLKWWRD